MKINSGLPSVASVPDRTRARGSAATAPAHDSASSEQVDISSLSARLQEIGTGEAPVDVERVAEIKRAIAEGRFQINPERIADGLLSSVRDMLGRSARPE